MPSTLRHIARDPHETPIAPDIVPADWADCVPHPANDALSREKLFAEIRSAAEIAAPTVDTAFRATDVNDVPALKRKRSSSRAWMRRAATIFILALVSAVVTAVWKHHGDAALETATNWMASPDTNSPAASDTPAVAEQAPETAATQPAGPAQPSASAVSDPDALPPAIEQKIQSMARDLAAMGQQIDQLKASIEAMKTKQNAAAETVPPAARAPAPKPPQPKVTALPPRPVAPPAPSPPRPANPPALQATAVPPPAPPVAPAPAAMPYQPPPQATTQPNGEPIPRPPMPMPLSDRH